jgi:DNA polymerase-1
MLIGVDAVGLEWRILVMLSNDQTAIQEILSGADIHSLNQAELNLPSRLIAKKFLFRTIYRGSGYAFSKDNEFKHVSTDPDFWDEKNEGFYKKYKGINECHVKWSVTVMNGKSLRGPSGRCWTIPPRDDGSTPWTTLTNYPVQGTGADLMAIARVSLRNRLKQSGIEGILVNTVHDSLIVDAPKKNIDKIAEMMYNTFDSLPRNMVKLWGIETPIPFPGEVKVGPNMADMEKISD